MPSKQQIHDTLTALTDQIAADLATPLPTRSDSATVYVQKGANLPDLIEQSSGDTTFVLANDFAQDLPSLTIGKPCTLKAASLPIGRVPSSFKGPTLKLATVNILAPNITLRGLRLNGTNRDAAIVQAWVNTSVVQCLLDGGTGGVKRGVLANVSGVTVDRSVILNIRHTDDAQAIIGWDGTKNLTVTDCQLESSGENIMLGGGDPSSESNTPQDVLIQHCWLRKPLAWKGKAGTTVKNLFELKNAKRVKLLNCTLENSWGGQGQTGYAIVLTVRNQYGGATYATIEDVEIADCTVKNAASGVQILARDDSQPSGRMSRVALRRNTFTGLQGSALAGVGHQVFISAGPKDLELSSNSFAGSNLNSFLSFDGPQFTADGLVVADNSGQEGEYGIFGSDAPGLGRAALELYAPDCRWERNRISRGQSGRWINYPEGTTVA